MKKEFFSGTFFLIISILVTFIAVVSLMDGWLNVFGILYAVACWLVYASARRNSEFLGGLGLGYGTTKALFIVNWVAVGILAVSGLVTMFAGRAIVNRLFSMLTITGSGFGYGYGLGRDYGDLGTVLTFLGRVGNVGYVWCGLTILTCAAAAAAVNLLFTRNLMTFVRSLRAADIDGEGPVEKAGCVEKWLFVLGILTALGVLSLTRDGLAASVSAASGAAMIVASRWIRSVFLVPEPEENGDAPSEWYSPEP